MALSDDINAHIAEISNLADTYAAAALSYASQAVTAASGWASTSPYLVAAPLVTIPPTNDPALVNMQALFTGDYNAIFSILKPYLDQIQADWLARFFPKVTDCIRDGEDDWICDVIDGNYSGIPAFLEEAIWNRGRDRELRDSSRILDDATSAFATRGFAYPPGAMNAIVIQVGQAEREKIVSISRDVAIKNIEVQIETIKFAITQATQLRLGVQSALQGYLNAYLEPSRLGISHASNLTSAQASLWNASGAYYGAIIGAKRLTLEAQMKNADSVNGAQATDVRAFSASVNAKVNAALSSAQYFANAASGALAALNTMSHIASIQNT